MLVVIGDLIADIIVLGASQLERGTDNPAEVRLVRGGSAANVASAAAVRHPTRFIGRVGADTLGDALVADLKRAGVDVRVQRGDRTGTIVVLVDGDGERTMVTDRGAAADLEAIDPAWLDDAEWIHLPLYGFAAPASRRALLEVCAAAAARGIALSVDLSSVATMRDLGAGMLRDLLEAAAPTVIFANRDEAELAAELAVDATRHGVWVVKRGGDPVLVHAHGTVAEVPIERTDAVDSTGAGDAFAAGYVAAALAGADPTTAARAGADLALEALRRPGAL